MTTQVTVYDGEVVEQGDVVAFYDRMSALNYTAARPYSCVKAVHGIDVVEAVNEHEIKGVQTGWWSRLSVIKLTTFLVHRWMMRYQGEAWPPVTGYNR